LCGFHDNIVSTSASLQMTPEEWNELNILKEAINWNPASVHQDKMERFTELLVKSLEGKGEYVTVLEPSNY
jgi:hypothetical protein